LSPRGQPLGEARTSENEPSVTIARGSRSALINSPLRAVPGDRPDRPWGQRRGRADRQAQVRVAAADNRDSHSEPTDV